MIQSPDDSMIQFPLPYNVESFPRSDDSSRLQRIFHARARIHAGAGGEVCHGGFADSSLRVSRDLPWRAGRISPGIGGARRTDWPLHISRCPAPPSLAGLWWPPPPLAS